MGVVWPPHLIQGWLCHRYRWFDDHLFSFVSF
jgi:hypothetical protein